MSGNEGRRGKNSFTQKTVQKYYLTWVKLRGLTQHQINLHQKPSQITGQLE